MVRPPIPNIVAVGKGLPLETITIVGLVISVIVKLVEPIPPELNL